MIKSTFVGKVAAKVYKSFQKKSITGTNNIITNNGLIDNVEFDIRGSNNKIIIGENSVLRNIKVYIRGDAHLLHIKDNCSVASGSFWFEDSKCEIILGNKTTVESCHFAATEISSKIHLGEDCMLATDIEIRTSDSHSIIDLSINKRINHASSIDIGDHVWIGAGVSILKGVSIGNNSIVGTRSVVTRNISSNVLAAGIPAKVIKENISWLRERI